MFAKKESILSKKDQYMYRVTLVVAHMGWVDYDFGHSTVCPVPLGQIGI